MTILLTPFMSCSAKLPIYSLFAVTFFPEYAALVMVGLYFLGILVGIGMAFLLKGTLFKGEAVPFVMELPNYRLPGLKNVEPSCSGKRPGISSSVPLRSSSWQPSSSGSCRTLISSSA